MDARSTAGLQPLHPQDTQDTQDTQDNLGNLLAQYPQIC